MQGYNQSEIESFAKWYVGVGCVFSEEFLKSRVGAEKMRSVDLTGAYVIRVGGIKPCMFVTFGASGAWVVGLPVMKMPSVRMTDAEQMKLGLFMKEVDPTGEFGVRTWTFHVELGSANVVRRPTDGEICDLHLKYRESKRPATKKGKKRVVEVDPDAGKRELRALDRRRFKDAGIWPPAERATDEYMKHLKNGPTVVSSWENYDGFTSDG